MRLLPPLLFALFLLPLLGGPLHAQEAASAAPATPGPKPDSVSVDRANGYARILFTFATPTPVTARPNTSWLDGSSPNTGTRISRRT